MSKSYTWTDVEAHATGSKEIWVVIRDKVHDVTAFIDEHPGGEEVLKDVGGTDATEAFEDVGHSVDALEILQKLQIGDLQAGGSKAAAKTTTAYAPRKATSSGGLTTYGPIALLVLVLAYVAFQML